MTQKSSRKHPLPLSLSGKESDKDFGHLWWFQGLQTAKSQYGEKEVKAIKPGNMSMDHRDKEQIADCIMDNIMTQRIDFSFNPQLSRKAKSAFFSTSSSICLVQLTVRGHSRQTNPSHLHCSMIHHDKWTKMLSSVWPPLLTTIAWIPLVLPQRDQPAQGFYM